MSEYNEQNHFPQEPEDPPEEMSASEPAAEGEPPREQAWATGENQASRETQPENTHREEPRYGGTGQADGTPPPADHGQSTYGWQPYQNPNPNPNQYQPPGNQGRYGANYSPNYYNNTYPPRREGNGYQSGYRPPQGGYPGQGYNTPYRYSQNPNPNQPPNWQQRQPEKYEWKFEDYDKLDRKKGRKPRNRGLVVFTVVLVGILAVGLIGVAGYSIWSAYSYEDAIVSEGEQAEQSAPEQPQGGANNNGELNIVGRPQESEASLPEGRLTIPQVAEAVLPSVVGVIKYDNDQYFEISGYGSGIIMSADGYIITNAHVVAGGTGFKVQFPDGDAYDAQLIGYDMMTDLAVVRIEATDLVPAQFGDSDEIKVGETVVAIGNPGGMELASSVTSGIISAVNREVRTVNYTMNYIQTDAAINPGNSGGALANEYGQVIGINSAKITAPDYEGIGFAIPISIAKPVIDDIIRNGKVTGRVMLGISSRKVVDEVDARNYQIQMGLMIDSVENPDLVAGGVQKGDILTHIDGERIYNVTDVSNTLSSKKVGDTVTVTIYRKLGTRETTFDVDARLMESQ